MTVLVTGGAGFIGSHLAQALIESSNEVRIVHRTPVSRDRMAITHPRAEHVLADVTDRTSLRNALFGVTTVYHLAGYGSPGSSHDEDLEILHTNVSGTCTLLQECVAAGVERFVFASSASVYGDSIDSPKTESMLACPKSVYAASKIAGENLCRVFHSQRALDTRILRYFNVYGPGQRANMVVPRFIQLLSTGQTVTLYGDGGQTRDFIHIVDVVRATIMAGAVPNPGPRIFNIASGIPTSVRELVETMAIVLGVEPDVAYVPARLGEIRESLASIDIARKHLGFSPSVPLKRGLASLAEEPVWITP